MAERLHPGVYVEEVSSGVRPIEGVSTSTAAFLGEAPRGQPNRATLCTSMEEYQAAFGGHRSGAAGYLAAGVEGFFDAGGRRAYVVRVMPADAVAATVTLPVAVVPAAGNRPVALAVRARGAGAWGSTLRLDVLASDAYPDEAFTLRVSVIEGGLSRTLETFTDVRMDPRSDDHVVRVVKETSRYIEITAAFPSAGASGDGTFAAIPAVGPRLAGKLPVSNTDAMDFVLEARQGDAVLHTKSVTLAASAGPRDLAAFNALIGPDFVATSPSAGTVVVAMASEPADVAKTALSLLLRDTLSVNHPRSFSRSFGFTSVATGFAANDLKNSDVRPAVTTAPVALANGSDGTGTPGPTEYFGDPVARTGIHALDTLLVNIIAIPGHTNEPAYVTKLLPWAEQHGAFAVLDGPGAQDDDFQVHPLDARSFIQTLPLRSKNAAMYYPWVKAYDPLGVGRNPTRFVPPSGLVAGIYARTDNSRGVWKAPAGIEATVPGALGLQFDVDDGQQDLLNPVGLNCIRQFSGTGIVTWGARTISSDPEWRYVPVRRTALFLIESIRQGMQWAVFEPNDTTLWERVRQNIFNFMLRLFQDGAFQGTTPAEAFLVRCDATTNPQANIDAGVVTARVYFAPLKPAEFVVIQVSQKTLVT
ncbi:MAG: phage tail sheath subtilisin-like domain-containing protein [Myxococcota bacterium]